MRHLNRYLGHRIELVDTAFRSGPIVGHDLKYKAITGVKYMYGRNQCNKIKVQKFNIIVTIKNKKILTITLLK